MLSPLRRRAARAGASLFVLVLTACGPAPELPDLAVTKTQDGPLLPGQNHVYFIDVENVGTGDAAGPITVTDVLPLPLSYVSAAPSSFSCSASGQIVTCTHPGPLAAGDSLPTLELTVSVPPYDDLPHPCELTNCAEVEIDEEEESYPNNESCVQSVLEDPEFDLALTKTSEGAVAGQDLVYTLAVENLGPDDAPGPLTVTDTLPPNTPLSAISAPAPWTCAVALQTVTCTHPGPLAAGATETLTLTVDVGVGLAGTALTNCANVSADFEEEPGNNESCVSEDVSAPTYDLALTKTLDDGELTPGGFASYLIEIENLGPDDAPGPLTVTDVVPPGLSIAGIAYAPFGACQFVLPSSVTCNLPGPLAAGATTSFLLHVQVDPDFSGPVTNCAQVSTPFDTDASNDEGCHDGEVAPAGFDLSLTKSLDGDLFAGATATFTLEVKNLGPVDAPGPISVTDTLPAGLSVLGLIGAPAPFSCSVFGQQVSCTLAGPLLVGDSETLGITVSVDPALTGSLQNCGAVFAADDLDVSNDESCIEVPVLGEPTACVTPPPEMVAWWHFDETTGNTREDIALTDDTGTLVGGPMPGPGVVAGALHFPGHHDAVVVNDPGVSELDVGTGDFSLDAWVRFDQPFGTRVMMDKRTAVPVGYSFFVTSGRLGLQMADGSSSGSSCTFDPAMSACTNWVAPPSATPVDLYDGAWHHVAATVDRDDPAGGHLYVDGFDVYTFDPTIRSGSLDNDVPLHIGRRSPTIGSGGSIGGALDEIEVFRRALTPAEVLALVNAGPAGKCKEPDSVFDLGVEKFLLEPLYYDSASSYQIEVTNHGPDDAAGPIVVTDLLPPGLSFTASPSADWSCTGDGLSPETVTCIFSGPLPASVGPLPPLVLEVQVASIDDYPAGSDLAVNCALLEGGDLDPANDQSCDHSPIDVPLEFNLLLNKRVTGAVSYGGTATYEIRVENQGPDSAPGPITVFDVLPVDFTFVGTPSADWSCLGDGNNPEAVTCDYTGPLPAPVGSLPPLLLEVQVPPVDGFTGDADAVENCARLEENDDLVLDDDESCVTHVIGVAPAPCTDTVDPTLYSDPAAYQAATSGLTPTLTDFTTTQSGQAVGAQTFQAVPFDYFLTFTKVHWRSFGASSQFSGPLTEVLLYGGGASGDARIQSSAGAGNSGGYDAIDAGFTNLATVTAFSFELRGQSSDFSLQLYREGSAVPEVLSLPAGDGPFFGVVTTCPGSLDNARIIPGPDASSPVGTDYWWLEHFEIAE